MPHSTDCPKCQGKMSEGVIVDMGYGQSVIAQWQPAPNSLSRWFGLKVRKKECLPTTSYRCTRCGYLESFANPSI